jgi:uracil-DNA glycosylase
MNVREHLLALNDELRRLKADGHRSLTVSEDNLVALREAVRIAAVEEVEPEPAWVVAEPPQVSVEIPPAAAPPRTKSAAAPIPSEAPVVRLPEGGKHTRWEALREQVLNNPVCRSHVRPGKKVVLGVGNLDATIFFCGEAPGAEEEVQGEPFVGPAGQLLTKMILGMGLKREEVYIGNIMNWRPEMPVSGGGEQYGNRPPTPEEMNFCLPFLRAQLDIVQPRIVVALGATAAGGLLGPGTFKALGEVRGRWHTFNGLPLMVTYHPSYILRNQSNRSKRTLWEDLLKVMERAGLPPTEKQRNYFLG